MLVRRHMNVWNQNLTQRHDSPMLVEARRAFHSRTADRDPAAAWSEHERVTTMIETYRAKGALDDALRGAPRRARTMMDTRGHR